MDHFYLKYSLALIFFFLVFTPSINVQPTEAPVMDSLQISTLESLKMLDDNLYYMDYRAEYNFDSFKDVGTGDITFEEFTLKYLDKVPSARPWACSAFMVKNYRATLAGRNFDWENIPGMILFTSPDSAYHSVSMVPVDLLMDRTASSPGENKKLLWAPYFPVEGINERGLVVAELAVEGERVFDENKLSMLSLHLTRLLLDYAANLEEALGLLAKYNNTASDRMHFFIADSSGSSAVVEYIDNNMVITGNKGPWQAVTNTMVYRNSDKNLRKSCSRYNFISKYLEAHYNSLLPAGAFNILRDISVVRVFSTQFDITTSTQWSVVYDLPGKSISVVSQRKYGEKFSYSLVE